MVNRYSTEVASRIDVPSVADRTLDELVSLVAGGSAQAFAELYDRTSSRVLGLCRKVLSSPSDAEEVVQEVFLEVWRKAFQFDQQKGCAISWILRITHSRAVDRLRVREAARRRDDHHARETVGGRDDLVLDLIVAGETAARIRDGLTQLSPLRREAVSLTYLAGHTYQEASDLLSVPVPTLKTRVRDGLLALRIAMS
jgi:RNA polymerase sigma-70 factor (ECF subfamily)